jgi:chloramphenicol O-acetyltransferase
LTAAAAGVKAHFVRYAKSYFVGALFVILQVMIAFTALGAQISRAQQAAMTRFDWLQFASRVGIVCFPVIIAYLNGTVAADKAAPPPPP